MSELFDTAVADLNAGRLSESESICRQLLAQNPLDLQAIHLFGLITFQLGRRQDALTSFDRAISIDSKQWYFHNNRGLALASLGRLEEAAQAFERGLLLNSESPEMQLNLGLAHRGLNQFDKAIVCYQRAIDLRPEFFEAYNNLGNALARKDQHPEAIKAFRKALSFRPDFPDALFNLGISLQATNQSEEAVKTLQKALALRPSDAEVADSLALIFYARGDFDQAVEIIRKGIVHHPDHAPLHWNLSQILLLRGESEQGWIEHEWRHRVPEFRSSFPDFKEPGWDGTPLEGKRILLHAEQGFGDTIYFARYIKQVEIRGGKIILAVQPSLLRLFRSMAGIEQLVATDQPLPAFDVHCPLPSLPFALKISEPLGMDAYLHADPSMQKNFEDVIRQAQGKLKVGLIWSGRARPVGRSVPLSMLAPLADPKIQFYSLQIGEGAEEAKTPPVGMNLIDVTKRIEDFADLAALIASLDLIIGIDTAATQLAAVLGKKTWTLLKFVPDWRWLLNRNDSPWFPTMKLFRQKRLGDWSDPISQLADELKMLAGEINLG